MSRYGCVLFDDPNRAGPGWASIAGDTAFRINGTGDLATDVVWIVNVEYQAFFRQGLQRLARLKRTYYLTRTIPQIMRELGLDSRFMPATQAVRVLAEIFDRTVRLAERHYGADVSRYDTLADGLRGAILSKDETLSTEIDQAVDQATQNTVMCEQRFLPDSTHLTFRRPRMLHARELLATPMPLAPWEFLPGEKMVPEARRMDWLLRQDRPVLAKIAVQRLSPEAAHLVAFGSGAWGRGKQKDRSWASHPELLFLSHYATVRVDAAFLGAGYAPLAPLIPLMDEGPAGDLSFSAGLLADSYVTALASPQPYHLGPKIPTPRAAWLRASDRFLSFFPAMLLDGAGFQVNSYGMGSVGVRVVQGNLTAAACAAREASLLVPLSLTGDAEIEEALA